jgi:hypothetical protein
MQRAAMMRGYTLGRRVADAEVLELVRSLRPRRCGAPLIRVGAEADGGYLIPDDLAGIEYCFSPGVSTTVEFERQLADRKIRTFLADYSIDAPPVMRSEFVFDRKFIGGVNNETFMTLASWKDKYLPGYDEDMLLQMDIEGDEYEVILSTPIDLLASFRTIVIELHSLERLFDRFAFRIMKAFFDKLLSRFYVVHAHPNNTGGVCSHHGIEIPDLVEMTFYNRDRGGLGPVRRDYPHPLDVDNCSTRASITLPACWRADDPGADTPPPGSFSKDPSLLIDRVGSTYNR